MSENSLALPLRMSNDLKMARSGFRVLGAVSPGLAGRVAVNLFLTPRRRPVSKNAQTTMSQAQSVAIQHGSRQLAGYVWPNDGPTVLLVHGWESNASGMRGFVRPLLAAGFQVAAFDAPAHGRSQGRQTNFVDYTGALQMVIHQIGPVYGVVAHSFGAAVTLYTLSQQPYLGVQRIVSLGAPSRLKDMVNIWTAFLGMSTATVEQMRRKLVDRVGVPVELLMVETAVTQLTIPGLIIHDQRDQVVSFANAEAIARNWQTATLQATEGLDHRGPLQDREVIRQVVAFLADDSVIS